MAERSRHAVSGGLGGRSERPEREVRPPPRWKVAPALDCGQLRACPFRDSFSRPYACPFCDRVPVPLRGVCYDSAMQTPKQACDLSAKNCVPCEGGVPRYSTAEAEAQLGALPAWRLTHDGTRIRRDVRLKNFREAVKLVNNVAALAEREQHHPDLHVEGYRNVWIEIFTHAIGGLSENDFILAAKIDAIAPA